MGTAGKFAYAELTLQFSAAARYFAKMGSCVSQRPRNKNLERGSWSLQANPESERLALWGLRDIRLFLPRIKIFRCVLCNLQFTSFAIELENTRGVELSSEFSLNSNSDLA